MIYRKPLLTIFFGLTGSGKSYLADAWAKEHGFFYFNTDVVRKTLAGIKPQQGAAAPVGQGIYSQKYSRVTYDSLLEEAKNCFIHHGAQGVVLDGSYSDAMQREKVVEHLSTVCRIIFVYCFCSESLTRKRLVERRLDNRAVSDGRLEIYLHQKNNFDPPLELPGTQLFHLNTDKALTHLVEQLDSFCLEDIN